MDRQIKKLEKAFSKLSPDQMKAITEKAIQATASMDGGQSIVNLENLLFAIRNDGDIDGTENKYRGYAAQVIELYLKYNSQSQYGNWLAKALVDTRTSFIAGEGLSVSAIKDKTGKWIEKLLTKNKLNGSKFFRAVKGGEMTGKALFVLSWDKDKERVNIVRIPYGGLSGDGGTTVIPGVNFKALAKNRWDKSSINAMVKVDGQVEKPLGYKNFVYVILGGDDITINNTVTKVGAVLTEIENYDKGLKDMRRSNYYVNRITPVFECKDDREAGKVRAEVQNQNWKIGTTVVTTAKFRYESASTTAADNTEKELQANAKAISTQSGVPVHWIGHTELMSNRSTAETLYEAIDNATKMERVIWSESMTEVIVKAMELAIDNGDPTINTIDEDFEVKIPLISFRQFKDNIAALSMAYTDQAISIDDYRNFIPGIDPLKTKKAIEKAEKDEFNSIKTTINDKEKLNPMEETKDDE